MQFEITRNLNIKFFVLRFKYRLMIHRVLALCFNRPCTIATFLTVQLTGNDDVAIA